MSGGRLDGWLVAIRPKTLSVGAAPVLVGSSVAAMGWGFRPVPALLALVGALLLQIASNVANDLYDFKKGADSEDRLGPPRAAAMGLLSERELLLGLGGILAAALASGLALAWISGWPILAIGLSGMVAAVAYTAGPYPLGYHGLGDVFVFAYFGLAAVAGTTFAQTGTWEPLALSLGAALGCFGAAVLTINNLRDLDSDRLVGKRTMAVRLGRSRALGYLGTLLAAPYAIVAAAVVGGALSPWALLVLLSGPRAWSLHRSVAAHRDGPTLNAALAGTAKLQALFSLILAGSCLLRLA